MGIYFHTIQKVRMKQQMVLQISSIEPLLKFPVFSIYKYLSTPLAKGEKKRNFLLGLGSFHAENIDITLTETAKASFVAIILIVNLIVYQSLTNCLSIYFITL